MFKCRSFKKNLFFRDLDESWRREEPCSFSSAPELSAPRGISDSGKHSPGIGRYKLLPVNDPCVKGFTGLGIKLCSTCIFLNVQLTTSPAFFLKEKYY